MLTFNGKKFNARDFQESMMDAIKENAKTEIAERFRSIRHPVTGEFPTVVVYGSDLDNLSLKIEGSSSVLDHVKKKIPEQERKNVDFVERRKIVTPKVFLSFASEDRQMAEKIAKALQRGGIDTWWSEWEISSGDSLRQRIDDGLHVCTHFVVLLTQVSIEKPWVKLEMDAGLVKMLENDCIFIPLRHDLSTSALPPLLRGRSSPTINDDLELVYLINDIHGISRKPPLGNGPIDEELPETGFSVAATLIAKLFCEESEHGLPMEPSFTTEEIAEKTGLTSDDTVDALYELRAFIRDDPYDISPNSHMFVEFDKAFMEWEPEADALRIAAASLNDTSFPSIVSNIAQSFDWSTRRINPAINYLVDRDICRETEECGIYPWAQHYIDEKKDGAIRRFVKSRI